MTRTGFLCVSAFLPTHRVLRDNAMRSLLPGIDWKKRRLVPYLSDSDPEDVLTQSSWNVEEPVPSFRPSPVPKFGHTCERGRSEDRRVAPHARGGTFGILGSNRHQSIRNRARYPSGPLGFWRTRCRSSEELARRIALEFLGP